MLRRCLVALLLFVWSTPAQAATAHVQSVKAEWSSGSSVCAAITATNGNALAISVHLVDGDNTNSITGVSDGTNTYTAIDSLAEGAVGVNFHLRTFYAKNITGGSLSVCAALTNASVVAAMIVVAEVSGADTAAPLDVNSIRKQTGAGTGADGVTATAIVTTVNDGYVYAAVLPFASTNTYTAGSAGTLLQSHTSTWGGATEYELDATAGSITPAFTAMSGGDHFIATFAFKAQGAAANARGCTMRGFC